MMLAKVLSVYDVVALCMKCLGVGAPGQAMVSALVAVSVCRTAMLV